MCLNHLNILYTKIAKQFSPSSSCFFEHILLQVQPTARVCCLFMFVQRGFMINPTAIERNHILVATATVGGPSERVVPPREIENWKVPLDQSVRVAYSAVTVIHPRALCVVHR